MSINLGIYDFFAYLVPGIMYLFLLNEFSGRLGWASFDVAQVATQGIGAVAVVVLAAYVVGNLFDGLAHWFCYKFLTRKSVSATTLETLKHQYPHLNIQFEPNDYHLLFVILRGRNPQFTQTLDRFVANSILLKNVSLASALYAVLQLSMFFGGFSVDNLLLFLGGLIACWLAYRSSKMYHTWFFLDVFEGSLAYGANVQEVLANQQPKTAKLPGPG